MLLHSTQHYVKIFINRIHVSEISNDDTNDLTRSRKYMNFSKSLRKNPSMLFTLFFLQLQTSYIIRRHCESITNKKYLHLK